MGWKCEFIFLTFSPALTQHVWNVKLQRESLEHKLSETEKEMSKLRTERDEAIRNHSNMESKVADLQVRKLCLFSHLCYRY